MTRVPIFIEVEETRKQEEVKVCSKAVAILTEKHGLPIGLVGTVAEAQGVLGEINAAGLSPAIFVVNTFGAKSVLRELDPLMGELPVLYLRRRLYAGRSGLMDQLQGGAGSGQETVAVLRGMTPRLTSMWFYGSRNSDEIARRVVEAIIRFVKDGNFQHIENAAPAGRED